MSDTIIIRRNGEKFAVDCSTVLEAFNGHLKVKFDGIICPKCGASDSCWIPVRKVEEGGEVAELRECLKETMADAVAEYKNNSCFRNVKCGEIERCDTCKVMRWRKALKGSSND